ncbi:MAG: type I-B CRISPR-associated endonuclease Cas1b [bacterium]
MKRTIYIFSDGELKRKENTLFFQTEKEQKYIPIEATGEIMVMGEVNLNKRFLELCASSEIILHFFNYYGYYVGSFFPRKHLNSGHIILKQCEHYLDEKKRLIIARKFVEGALENIKRVLRYYKNRGKEVEENLQEIERMTEVIGDCRDIESLMALEGNARIAYYSAFDKIIEDENFSFNERSKRPPQNRLNALISFGNSLLYVVALSEIYHTHLDPRIGYLHTSNFRSFTLNLDVAEVFKPIIVDRLIFYLLNKKMLGPQHFEPALEGIILNEKGRKIFVSEFEERLKGTVSHPDLGRNVSYRRLIRLELYKIEKHIMGEKEYKPYVSRW